MALLERVVITRKSLMLLVGFRLLSLRTTFDLDAARATAQSMANKTKTDLELVVHLLK